MPVRASRRAGVEVPYDVQYAIASNPAAFDAKVMEWDARKQAALEAEARANAAVAAAKAEQDALAKDRATFNTQQTEARAKLAGEQAVHARHVAAEEARLRQLESDAHRRDASLSGRESALEGRLAQVARDEDAAATAKQAYEMARDKAEGTLKFARNLDAVVKARMAKLKAAMDEPVFANETGAKA